MKLIATLTALAAVGAVAHAQPRSSAEPSTEVYRPGSSPMRGGEASHFLGDVKVEAHFRGAKPARVGASSVTFAPGARSAWHAHPFGQTLIVTKGCGLTQARGGKVERICAGDVAWIGPGQQHWHGATPTSAMTHVAVSETARGQEVVWSRHVTEAEYRHAGR